MKKITIVLIAVIALALIACGGDDNHTPTHNHDFQWKVTTQATDTADGVETETCSCGKTNGTRPLYKVRETTITAFSKSITVKSDGTVSYANFYSTENSAKTKLQGAMTEADSWATGGTYRPPFITMLERTGFAIIVQSGNAEPAPNAQKQMTVGIGYLLANNTTDIGESIYTKVVIDNAFAN